MATMGFKHGNWWRIKGLALALRELGNATTIGVVLAYGPESPESVKLTIDTYFKPLLD